MSRRKRAQGTPQKLERFHADSVALCRYMREQTGPAVLLSFSGGKDAIGAWLQLREHFEQVVPYYLYMVPDLEFVEEGLQYFEREMGVPIIRVPHPSFWRYLRELVFQPPDRAAILEQYDIPNYTFEQKADFVRHKADVPAAYTATGVRAVDSPMRWHSVKKHGPINVAGKRFMPIYDWRLADVIAAIERAKVKLPVDYRLFGRTFDGLDYRFLEPIKRHFPRDFDRICEWFPMAELELFRRNLRGPNAVQEESQR